MGDTRDQMDKTTDLRKKKSPPPTPDRGVISSLGDRLLSRGKKPRNARTDLHEPAETFADHVAGLDDELKRLIEGKEGDLLVEADQKAFNEEKIELLREMQEKVDDIIDLAHKYSVISRK